MANAATRALPPPWSLPQAMPEPRDVFVIEVIIAQLSARYKTARYKTHFVAPAAPLDHRRGPLGIKGQMSDSWVYLSHPQRNNSLLNVAVRVLPRRDQAVASLVSPQSWHLRPRTSSSRAVLWPVLSLRQTQGRPCGEPTEEEQPCIPGMQTACSEWGPSVQASLLNVQLILYSRSCCSNRSSTLARNFSSGLGSKPSGNGSCV